MELTLGSYYVTEELVRFLRAIRLRRHKNMKRDNALFSFYAGTGVRATEGLRVRVGDLRMGAGTKEDPCLVRVRRLKKRGQEVVSDVFFSSAVRYALMTYLRSLPEECKMPDSPLFPMTRQGLWSLAKYYANQSGVEKRCAIHAFRHTRAVMLYQETRDVAFVMHQLGHARIETTMIYVHVVDGMTKAAAVDLPDLGLPPMVD